MMTCKDCNGFGSVKKKSARGNKYNATCETCGGCGRVPDPDVRPHQTEPMTDEEWLEDLESRTSRIEAILNL